MEQARTISVEQVMELVEYIARNLVDEPDAVKVELRQDAGEAEAASDNEIDSENEQRRSTVTIALTVAKDDTGKVIGKQGRIAKAIRTVVRAATVKGDIKYRVDIM